MASGTSALSVAVGALGLGPGDEVLVPGLMWVSCISAVVRVDAIPRLVDIDETFCIDPEDLKAKIGPRTRAVLCVHMSGAPGRIGDIAQICRHHGLALIEDCAQAAGARQDGTPAGRFGDIGIFSFQLNKTMTSGEGGMVVTDRDDLYKRMVAVHDLGVGRDEQGRLDPTDENCQLWGVGARMSELAGALALAQLRKLPDIVASMRDAKWRIRTALSDIDGLTFREIVDPAGDSGLVLIFTLPDADLCAAFVDAVRAEGIAGPSGSLAVVMMREWGLHWHFNTRASCTGVPTAVTGCRGRTRPTHSAPTTTTARAPCPAAPTCTRAARCCRWARRTPRPTSTTSPPHSAKSRGSSWDSAYFAPRRDYPGGIHPPKHEIFDLVGRTNTDPKGIVRAVDVYTVRPWGLYMARPTPGRTQFHYLESWLIPSLGIRVNIFHFNAGYERDQDFYLDIGEFTSGEHIWEAKDHYLDLVNKAGVGTELVDIDELIDAHHHGLIPSRTAVQAIERAFHVVDGLSRHEHHLDRWLASNGMDLTWQGAYPV